MVLIAQLEHQNHMVELRLHYAFSLSSSETMQLRLLSLSAIQGDLLAVHS